ncbi:MAG: bacteriohemerythrin, partial [candidate division Zixibacteria bacterium]|nr:bacteriohemerythrin [candidate division Zixibacteria bacterium]
LDGEHIDRSNEEFIRLFNQLHASVSFGDGDSEIEAHLNDFFNYCQTIFADEEELMERIMYSHYEVHRADHESLLGKSHEIHFKLKSDSTWENAEGLRFLSEWIIEHIEGEAARYVNYVNQNNVSPENMFVTWDRNYSIDIDEFDSQHKKLLKSINHIYDLDRSDYRAREMETCINQFINDLKFHTFAEEDLMRKIKYPKAEWHKKEHEKIIITLLEIQKNHVLGKAADPVKLAHLLKNWLIDHIHSADKDYSKFFHKDAINLAKLFVSWDQSLSVGQADLDKQHKNILHILNQLHAAMNIESERKNLSRHLENLGSEIGRHFHAEEELMTEIDYPHLEDHQKAHRKLIKQVRSLQIWTKQERAMTARKDLRLIKSWLIDHIKFIDMKYARFIAKRRPERVNTQFNHIT